MTSKKLDQGHVYLITNINNGKRYVGQTWYELSHRWGSHKSHNKRGCPYLYKAIVKHGASSFTIESLARFSNQETADLLEKFYIDFYCSNDPQLGYNLTGGGQGKRPPMSQAIRDKISQTRRGFHHSEEAKRKISEAQLNVVLSENSQKSLDASRARKRKLTMEQAEEIRQEYKDGMLGKLARKYNVSTTVIYYIIHNITYIKNYTK